MERIALGDGRWFDKDAATEYEESTRWNGNNHISCATGSQWEHEALYYTRGGTWVLHSWSAWQGSIASYDIISDDAATRWLVRNDHDLPESLAPACAALEV